MSLWVVQLDLWGLAHIRGSLSFFILAMSRGDRHKNFDIVLLPSPIVRWQRKCCAKKGNSDWKIAVIKKNCNIMKNLATHTYIHYIYMHIYIYISTCVHIYMDIVTYVYIYQILGLTFLCTNNMHFKMCLYCTAIELYTSTLSSCNSSLHIMHGEC